MRRPRTLAEFDAWTRSPDAAEIVRRVAYGRDVPFLPGHEQGCDVCGDRLCSPYTWDAWTAISVEQKVIRVSTVTRWLCLRHIPEAQYLNT